MTYPVPDHLCSDIDLFTDAALHHPHPWFRQLRDIGSAADLRPQGNYGCAGQGLARLEALAVFKALAQRVQRFELMAAPERGLNNTTRSCVRLRVRAVGRG